MADGPYRVGRSWGVTVIYDPERGEKTGQLWATAQTRDMAADIVDALNAFSSAVPHQAATGRPCCLRPDGPLGRHTNQVGRTETAGEEPVPARELARAVGPHIPEWDRPGVLRCAEDGYYWPCWLVSPDDSEGSPDWVAGWSAACREFDDWSQWQTARAEHHGATTEVTDAYAWAGTHALTLLGDYRRAKVLRERREKQEFPPPSDRPSPMVDSELRDRQLRDGRFIDRLRNERVALWEERNQLRAELESHRFKLNDALGIVAAEDDIDPYKAVAALHEEIDRLRAAGQPDTAAAPHHAATEKLQTAACADATCEHYPEECPWESYEVCVECTAQARAVGGPEAPVVMAADCGRVATEATTEPAEQSAAPATPTEPRPWTEFRAPERATATDLDGRTVTGQITGFFAWSNELSRNTRATMILDSGQHAVVHAPSLTEVVQDTPTGGQTRDTGTP